MQHTPEQCAVIQADIGNLLVSAAAGSGKTAVLTERIVRRIIAEQLDIRQVLVMTFTDAAARQMKDKIVQKLQEALADEPSPAGRQRLNRQLSLLPGASISTIHSFCLDVIRNFYNYAMDKNGQLLVEPGFGIDDGRESGLLLSQTLDEYISGLYEKIDLANGHSGPDLTGGLDSGSESSAGQDAEWPADRQEAFFRLMDGYGGSRNDETVRRQILSLHRFLRSLPDYPLFVKSRLETLREAARDFSSSPHSRELIRMLSLRLDHAVEAAPEMQCLLEKGIRFIGDSGRNANYRRQFVGIINTLEQLAGYLAAGGHDWDVIRQTAQNLTDLDLPRAGRGDTPEKQRFLALFCENVAEIIHFLSGSCGTTKYLPGFLFEPRVVFNRSSAEIEADLSAMLPSVNLLFEMVLDLDREYSTKKRAAGMIDFSDFEHLALAILRHDDVREYYRRRYSEIYVDEYQDTSSIQEAIIGAVSNGNCLMVGDIKQSIYRFRHARPRIFLEKAAAFKNGCDGRLYELNRNFRSVPGILDAVNQIFRQLMSPGAGEIDYDDSQALVPDRIADPAVSAPVHLILVNRQAAAAAAQDAVPDAPSAIPTAPELDETSIVESDDDLSEETALAEELSRDRQEALTAICKMQLLHNQGYSWHDMVVLTRTRAIGNCYYEQMVNFGIPAWLPAEDTFLDSPVMRQMEALIHLLDNGRQDIPLAAVMRSGLYRGGFSAEEFARIRLEYNFSRSDPGYYHEAALAYSENGSDRTLREKLAGFFCWLDDLRDREQVMRLGELIGQVYAGTGWLDRLAAQPNGPLQIRRLRQFQQWTEQYERTRQKGLYTFARYLENLRENGPVESPFSAETVSQDVVRIMTIHGSKGLEFPIVFLAGTGYNPIPKDSRDSVLISESLGIGMDFADPESQIRYPSHLKLAMLEEIKAAGLAEEMRLLYVAMTRAKEQLFIAGTVRLSAGTGDSRLTGLLRRIRRYSQEQLPDHLVLSGRSYLEWLIMALARLPGCDLSWLENGLATERSDNHGDPDSLDSLDSPESQDIQKSQGSRAFVGSWTVEVSQIPDLIRRLAERPAEQEQEASDDIESAQLQEPEAPDGIGVGRLQEQGQSLEQKQEKNQVLQRMMASPYRFALASGIPAKVSVSELKRQSQAWSEMLSDEEPALQAGDSVSGLKTCSQDFSELLLRGISLTMHDLLPDENDGKIEANRKSAARLGTVLHAFLHMIDLPAACRDPEIGELRRQMEIMQQPGMIDEADSRMIDPLLPQILSFVQSGLAREMAAAFEESSRRIYQEIPFTLSVPASEIFPGRDGFAPDDQILVQGIIDCWYENENGITLVDFKSDYLPENQVECLAALKSRYSLQMEYYARAIQTVAGLPVKRRLIWLIRQGRAYEIGMS